MNGELFISIYLDEDVHLIIAELITARGFKTVTARGAGQLGKTDAEQLAYAVDRGLCVVTHNRGDFQELHRQYVAKDQDTPASSLQFAGGHTKLPIACFNC